MYESIASRMTVGNAVACVGGAVIGLVGGFSWNTLWLFLGFWAIWFGADFCWYRWARYQQR